MKKRLLISVLSLVALVVLISFPLTALAATYTVNVQSFSFTPPTLNINAGDTVKWVFQSSGHTTTSGSNCTPDNKWDSGFIASGGTFQFTFNSAGTYPYFCTAHCDLGMTGNIVVSPTAAGISVAIQANGSISQSITIKSSDTLTISIKLSSGSYAGTNADWWFVEQTPAGTLLSFDVSKTPPTFGVPGLKAVVTTNLFDLPYTPVYQVSGLQPGNYLFAFGVDTTPNGSLDVNTLTPAAVQVTVTQ
ncbi:MAG: cupredoxin domain-containing protein [Nitrospirae bacterium]|nr:cupredoxin domain-containing protein [Nitrospirota bacterium]